MGYGTRTGADAYHLARGNSLWAGSNELKDQALVRAQDYIQFSYVAQFSSAYDLDAPNVENATYEAALKELIKPGFFTKTYTEAERKVLIEIEGVKWQVVGAAGGIRSMAPVVTLIDAMLYPYMNRYIGSFVV